MGVVKRWEKPLKTFEAAVLYGRKGQSDSQNESKKLLPFIAYSMITSLLTFHLELVQIYLFNQHFKIISHSVKKCE